MIANKEKSEIHWDRKSKDLYMEISFVNRWSPVDIGKVKMTPQFVKPHPEAVRPWITSVKEVAPYPSLWKTGEVRKYAVSMSIVDAADPAQTRIPSDLDLSVDVKIGDQESRRYVFETEVTVEVNPDLTGKDVRSYSVEGVPKGRVDFVPLDQNLDSQPEKKTTLPVWSKKMHGSCGWFLTLVTTLIKLLVELKSKSTATWIKSMTRSQLVWI